MSARITIQSGIAAGTAHDVDRRVVRVGSDPQSDICLPSANIPAHALTLEFRDEGCRIYNRCRNNVYVGAHVVAPDEVAAWPETDILELDDEIELLLDLNPEDEPGVSMSYDEAFTEAPTPAAPESSKQTENRANGAKTVIQLAVTVVCLIGCVLLLVRDQTRKEPQSSGSSFEQVIDEAFAAEVSPALIKRLQHAEALRIRGRKDHADREFMRIRDDLVTVGPTDSSHKGILELTQSRLGASK